MVLTGHRRGVWDIDFCPIDQLIASSSGDLTIKICDFFFLNNSYRSNLIHQNILKTSF